MDIIKELMKNNPCYKAGTKIIVKGIMLHSVGTPQPKAMTFINAWNNASYKRACVHAFVDGNTGTVYQTLPWDTKGWHSGGRANGTHIGVEVCEPSSIKYTRGSLFTCSDLMSARESARKTYKSSVELFAYLCNLFHLNPLEKGVIISHSEGYKMNVASNHGDIEHLWKGLGMSYTMDGFRQDVKNAMASGILENGVNSNTTNVSTITSTIKVGDLVKVRAGSKTYEGKQLSDFTYARTHEVKSITGQRAVITFNGIVIAGMNLSDLILESHKDSEDIKVGDSVRINLGASTYEGKRLSPFIYDRVLKVKSIKEDRVVVTHNGIVIAGMNKKDLTIVK